MGKTLFSRSFAANNPKQAIQWFRNDNKSKGRTMQYKVEGVQKRKDGYYEVFFTQYRKNQTNSFVLRSLSGRRL